MAISAETLRDEPMMTRHHETVVTMLRRAKNASRESLAVGAFQLLDVLIDECARSEAMDLDKHGVLDVLFTREHVVCSSDMFRQRLKLINARMKAQSSGIRFLSRKSFVRIDIDSAALKNQQQSQIVTSVLEHSDKEAPGVRSEYAEPHAIQVDRPELKVFFSYAHDQNPTVLCHNQAFAERLQQSLKTLPETYRPLFQLSLWFDKDLNHSDAITPQCDRECDASFLGILFWSDRYEHSNACMRECTHFLTPTGKKNKKNGKRALVLPGAGNADDMADRFKHRLIGFPDEPYTNIFSLMEKGGQSDIDVYVGRVRNRICEAATEFLKTPGITQTGKQKVEKSPGSVRRVLADKQRETRFDFEFSDHVNEQPQDPKGRELERGEPLLIVDTLVSWATSTSQQEPRLVALLGEFGAGKTVTAQMLTRRLLDAHTQDNTSPLPIYLDIRRLLDRFDTQINQPLDVLIETMLESGSPAAAATTSVSARDVMALISRADVTLVFDGLDEVGNKIGRTKLVALYRQLLGLIPAGVWQQAGEGSKTTRSTRTAPVESDFPTRSRILVTCRNHFFRETLDEKSFFSGQDRHQSADDQQDRQVFRRYVMLPFTDEQILNYLIGSLGEVSGRAANQMIRSVHDLSGLAAKPIFLRFIRDLIPELEQLRDQHQHVNAATLYDTLFKRALIRDEGKQTLSARDKQQLLGSLAVHLWRHHATSLTADGLDEWFDARIPASIRSSGEQHYWPVLREVLFTDLHNASLLVREGESHYRFAHNSFFEYFLAMGLVRDIVTGEPCDWFKSVTGGLMPSMPSTETLLFVHDIVQCSDEPNQAQFQQRFLSLLDSGRERQVRQFAFELWFLTLDQTRPPCSLATRDLSGLDLSERRIHGTASSMIDWSDSNLTNTNLSRAQLSHIDFRGSCFNRAPFSQAMVTSSLFQGATFDGVDWGGTRMFRCDSIEHVDSYGEPTLWPMQICMQPRSNFEKHPLKQSVAASYHLHYTGAHTSAITSVAFSPDGSRIVSGSGDSSVRLWDADSGACLRVMEEHTDWVRSVAFSPDGSRIVSGSHDKSVRLWDADSGACLRVMEEQSGSVMSVAFSPDGSRIVSGSHDKSVRLWDADSGACLRVMEEHTDWVRSVAFSPDGSRIVSGSHDKSVRLWDADSGACLRVLEEHSDWVMSVAFSPDGSRIVSGSGDSSVRLWDADSGACLRVLEEHSDWVMSVAFSPDGSRIVSGSGDSSVRLWDADSGACLRVMEEQSGSVRSVAFSPDGSRIVSGSGDSSVRLWDADSGACLRVMEEHSDWVMSVAFSPDGSRIVSGSGDSSVRLWDADSGACLRVMEEHTDWVRSVAFSPDGSRIVSGSGDSSVRLWDADSGACLRVMKEHTDWVTSVAFSPDGSRIVSGSGDSSVRLWDADSGACLRVMEEHSDWVTSVAFSPDGSRIVSGSGDSSVRLWDADSGACLRVMEEHSDWVTSVAFSPDGSRIVSGSGDSSVRLWDADSGACLRVMEEQSGSVMSVAFSPDGSRIVSGSGDSSVRLWDADSGACLRVMEEQSGSVRSVAFSPDGSRIVFAGFQMMLVEVNDTALTNRQSWLLLNGGHILWAPDKRCSQAVGPAWKYLFCKIQEPNGPGRFVAPDRHPDWNTIYFAQ